MKRLSSFGCTAGVGLLAGIMLTILGIWWAIYVLWRITELSKTGTRVVATVTQVVTHQETSFTFTNRSLKRLPVTIHQVAANWQDPQTGKTYTLKALIRNPDKFPVGSSIPFFIDPRNPKWWHRLENLQDV